MAVETLDEAKARLIQSSELPTSIIASFKETEWSSDIDEVLDDERVYIAMDCIMRWLGNGTKGIVESNAQHIQEMLSMAREFIRECPTAASELDLVTFFRIIKAHELGEIASGDPARTMTIAYPKFKEWKDEREEVGIAFLRKRIPEPANTQLGELMDRYKKRAPGDKEVYAVKAMDTWQPHRLALRQNAYGSIANPEDRKNHVISTLEDTIDWTMGLAKSLQSDQAKGEVMRYMLKELHTLAENGYQDEVVTAFQNTAFKYDPPDPFSHD